LLSKASAADAALPRTRSRGKLSAEQQANNAVRDNFAGMGNAQIYSKMLEGKTLYQVVLEAKVRNMQEPGSVRTGRNFYQELRNKYAGEESVVKQLKVLDTSLDINTTLFKAMVMAKRTPPNRAAMIEFLETAEMPNQSVVVGVLKRAVERRPSVSCDQLTAGMAVLRWFARLQLQAHFPKELGLVRSHLDDILAQAPPTHPLTSGMRRW